MRQDMRTIEEVEKTRCLKSRKTFQASITSCPCGKKGSQECNREPNYRVPRIRRLLGLD